MTLSEKPSFQSNVLGHLVVLQLKALTMSEAQLRQRYSSLLTASTFADWQTWTREMYELRLRTDRLARLLDALEGNIIPDQFEENTYAAA